jgi:hypothetical protein
MAKDLLRLQTWLVRLMLPFTVTLYFLIIRAAGYRVRDIERIRRECLEQFSRHRGPWVVCANHLTLIDSMILVYGMLSFTSHFTNYRNVPWNLPEQDNFHKKNFLIAVLCYIAKCIPINRGGDRDEMKKTLDKCNYVLSKGQSLMIFPEGGRSRTGRVDTEGFSYGVGRFVKDHPDCKVMCLYLRGDHQVTYGNFPQIGEHFSMMMEVLEPGPSDYSGMRAQRFYAEQIIQKLARMEENYFAIHRERRRQLERFASPCKEREYSVSQPGLYPK